VQVLSSTIGNDEEDEDEATVSQALWDIELREKGLVQIYHGPSRVLKKGSR
jgi:hypothetical protein